MNGVGKVSGIIQAIGALIGLFPGVAVIYILVDIPPTLIGLVKMISFSVVMIVLISVFLLRDWIRGLSNARAVLYGLLAVAGGAASATGYYRFATTHMAIPIANSPDKFVIPYSPSARIHGIVDPMNGDYEEALRTAVNRETLKRLMEEESGTSVLIMIVLLVFAEVLLIAPVVAACVKLTSSDPNDDSTNGAAQDSGGEPAP